MQVNDLLGRSTRSNKVTHVPMRKTGVSPREFGFALGGSLCSVVISIKLGDACVLALLFHDDVESVMR